MLVLKLLEKQPKYGYQIISELREKSGGVFDLKEGTLYPVLYRLEDDAFVKSEWSGAEGKKVARKYYQITEEGKQALSEIHTVWKQLYEGITMIMEVAGDD